MTTLFKATQDGTFFGPGVECQCAIGKHGVIAAAEKTEGDGAAPLGVWTMKRVFWRSDRLARPHTGLETVPLRPHDGWCDAPDDPLYNRPVRLPYPASHEVLWREDHVYDLIVELDHNSSPVVANRGSAIFFHLAHFDYRPTEGCVAISLEDMLETLAVADRGARLEIAL